MAHHARRPSIVSRPGSIARASRAFAPRCRLSAGCSIMTGSATVPDIRRWSSKERSMPEEIKAHITGIVFQIAAAPGVRVGEGDPVIILESMKMEIPVESPRAGIVAEIRVTEGQTVQEGETVALLE